MTGAALLLFSTLAVLTTAAGAAILLGLRTPLDWLLGTAVLAAGEVLLVSLVAGVVLHRYDRVSLTVMVTASALPVVAGSVARADARSVVTKTWRSGVEVLRTLSWWQWLLLVVAIASTAWRVVLSALLPPFAYDALTYHLTAVASWLQANRIGVNPYSVCCDRYPSTGEVMHAWPAVFLENDVLVDVSQAGFAITGSLAVAGLARLAGCSTRSSIVAASLFALTPIVLTQANTSYVDVTIATCLLLAVYFSARYLSSRPFFLAPPDSAEPRLGFLVPAAVGTGLALGTKTHGILLALVVALLVLGQLTVAALRRHFDIRDAVGAGALFVAVLALVGSWWYARNWVQIGNPIWPIRVDALGIRIFSGRRDLEELLTVPPGGKAPAPVEVARSWAADLTFWDRGGYSYEERSGGLGPLWSWLGWWLVGILAVVGARRRPAFVLNVMGPLVLITLLQPYKWWSRFTIQLAALGAIAIAFALDRAPRRARIALASATVLLALATAGLATWTLDPASRAPRIDAVELVRRVTQPDERTVGRLFLPEYRWLDDVPEDSTVAVEVFAPSIRFVYPMFGSEFARRVVLLFPGGEDDVRRRLHGETSYAAVESGGAYDLHLASTQGARRVASVRGVSVYELDGR